VRDAGERTRAPLPFFSRLPVFVAGAAAAA
jgi:hypothetical protein